MYNINGVFGMTIRELTIGLMAFAGASAMIILTYYSFQPSKNLVQNSDMNNNIYGSNGIGSKFKNTLDDYDY